MAKPQPITASQFHARSDLPDWRFMVNSIETTFRAGSFEAAASLIASIAAAAEAADHHPDIDMRYPDRVHVRLATHTAGGVTDRDVGLAEQISALAASAGAPAAPVGLQQTDVGIDALDIAAVRPFWAAVLGYKELADGSLADPVGIGPPFWFQQMDEPRPQRNRVHIDITVPHDAAEQRIAAALEAGGRLLTDQYARSWWVLADAEGNEACICTWQDRD